MKKDTIVYCENTERGYGNVYWYSSGMGCGWDRNKSNALIMTFEKANELIELMKKTPGLQPHIYAMTSKLEERPYRFLIERV